MIFRRIPQKARTLHEGLTPMTEPQTDTRPDETALADIQALADAIRAEVGKVIIGQTDTVDLMLTALLSRGHILLEFQAFT